MKQKRNMKKRKNNNNRFAFGLKNDAFRKNDLSIKRCDIFNTGGEDNDRQAGKPDSAME